MATTVSVEETGSRVIHSAAAAAHLVVAIALIALAVAQASILLPVAISIPVGDTMGVFARVDLAAAAAIVLLISAAMHAASAILLSNSASDQRSRLLQLIAFAQSSAITLFLVAQLNGVAEAGALILVYAIAGAAAGLLWLQAHEVDDRARDRWPFSFGAALAVVPWGIVALYQIVALVAGSPPAPLVRVVTVVILVIVGAAWWVERRLQLGTVAPLRAALLHAALSLANGIALLVVTVGLSRPSALL